MPYRMAQAQLKNFTFAYISAFIIILATIVIGQGLIQYTASQQLHERAIANTLAKQALRSQYLLRNAILLVTPGPYTQPYKELHTGYLPWRVDGDAMYTQTSNANIHPSDFSAQENAQLAKVKVNYLAMEKAIEHLFSMEGASTPKKAAPDVGNIFFNEVAYLTVITAIYNARVTQADSNLMLQTQLDFVLALIGVFTLLCEAGFVIRPANKQMQAYMKLLAEKYAEPPLSTKRESSLVQQQGGK